MRNEQTRKAIAEEIRRFTNGSGARPADIIFGPYAKRLRYTLRDILGLPKPANGFNAIRAALFEAFGVEGNCLAEREDNLAAAIRATLS